MACLILSSICLNRPLALKRTFDLECVTWDQKLNAQQNGLLLSFCLNLQWLSVQEPEGYQPEKKLGKLLRIIMNSRLGAIRVLSLILLLL